MKKMILGLMLLIINLFAIAQPGTDSVTGKVFDKVEVEAEFKGGFEGWRKYLVKSLNSNVPIKNGAPIGEYQVIVRFIVSKTGAISDVEVETAHGYGMEQEVKRIITKGPDWQPAQQNGKPVNAYRRQPVTFVVEQPGIEIHSKISFKLVAGEENPVTIDVKNLDNDQLEMTLTNGTIKHQSGNRYIINTTGTGKAMLEIFNTKKGRKKVAAACFYIIKKA